jgi:rubrerythrin
MMKRFYLRKEFLFMAFFDNLGKKAQAAASIAGEKAKIAADTAKINIDIASEQREIDKNYKTIGEWYVSEHQNDEVPEAIVDVVAAIKAAKEKIAELEASKPGKTAEQAEPAAEAPKAEDAAGETAEAPAKKICPICGAASEGKFCPSAALPWANNFKSFTLPPDIASGGFFCARAASLRMCFFQHAPHKMERGVELPCP